MDGSEFVNQVCRQLVRDLTANDEIRAFTNNPDLIGGVAEASLRQFVKRMVAPLHVSRGAIIYEGNCGPGSLRQLDAIIWQPSPLPAVFEAGDFAFVPRTSALSFLEIKATDYQGCGRSMTECLDLAPALEDPHLGRAFPFALGVVCLRRSGRRDTALARLETDRRAVVLLDQGDDGRLTPNPTAY